MYKTLEECYKNGEMQTWYNALKYFPVNFMKNDCHLERGI